MNHIRDKVFQNFDLPDKEWEAFSRNFNEVHFSKKEIITQQDAVENYLYFLEDGIVRGFFEQEDRQITVVLKFSSSFFSCYDSFIDRKPSFYSLEALTDCVCWRIKYEDLMQCYNGSMIGNQLGRIAAERLYIEKAEREKSFLAKSAKERYLELFNTNPKLLANVPLKFIASYIGVTPQALSRIRGKIN